MRARIRSPGLLWRRGMSARGFAPRAGPGAAPTDRPRSEHLMSDSSARRPLALTATLATSVAAAAGMITPAHATTASPNGTANLTLSGGSSSAPSSTATVTGTKYALNFAAGTRDLAWAPTGARAAWIDATSGAVLTGVPGGASAMAAPAP